MSARVITVDDLIKWLEQFPRESGLTAYEAPEGINIDVIPPPPREIQSINIL